MAIKIKTLKGGTLNITTQDENTPLCFTANEDNSWVSLKLGTGEPISAHLEYSLKDTNHWIETDWDGGVINLPKAGDKVYIRASQDNTNGLRDRGGQNHRFSMGGSISASGNIQYLLTKDGSRMDVPELCYYTLFMECPLTSAPKLPATTLSNMCYEDMFYGCESLTKAPELPATNLAQYCYLTMFYNCISLKISENGGVGTKILDLPVGTEEKEGWNYNMFVDTSGTFTGNPEIGKAYYCYQ